MTASRGQQTAFSSGEIDPRLHSREDFQRHQSGLAVCTGFLPMRQGGVTRAPGTIYRGTTRGNAVAVRIPFVFAADDAIELEFTDGKMRVWRYGALVESGGAPYELDTPFTLADLPRLNAAQDADVMYLLDGRNPMQQLSRFDLDDWALEPADLEAGPFRAQNLDEDRTIQCSPQAGGAVVAWGADVDLTIGTVRRSGTALYEYRGTGGTLGTATDGTTGGTPPTHDSGTEGYETELDPASGEFAYWDYVASTDLEPGTSTVYLTSTGDVFDAAQVGALLRLEPIEWRSVGIWVGNQETPIGSLLRFDGNVYRIGYRSGEDIVFTGDKIGSGANPPTHSEGTVRTDAVLRTVYQHVSTDTGIVKITAVTDANTAEALVIEPLPQPLFEDETYRWSMGAWNAVYGHPNYIAFYEQRLIAAGVPEDPRGLAASEQGAYRSFLPGADATDSFTYDIGGSGNRNAITWLFEGPDGVYIGSLGGVKRGHADGAAYFGPDTFDTDIVSKIGAAPVAPVAPHAWPVYISSDRARVLELRYKFEQDRAQPLELSLPSRHLGAPGFEQIAWQGGPEETGWLRRSDGILVALIYDPEQDVLGWSTVPLAGGFVEHISVSPSADGSQDVVTLIVRREIDGETLRCVEEMATPRLSTPVLERNHAFCSAVLTADPATDTFSVPHLAGETVSAWTNEGGFDGLTVAADGTVTLPFPATRAIIGLFDDSHRARTLPLRAAARDGDSRGRKRQLNRGSGIMILDTAGGWVRALERHNGQDWVPDVPRRLFERPALSDIVARSGTLDTDTTTAMADEVALEFLPQGLAPLTVTGIIPAIQEEGA